MTEPDVQITACVTKKTDRKLQKLAHDLETTKGRLITAILGGTSPQQICQAFENWPDCEL